MADKKRKIELAEKLAKKKNLKPKKILIPDSGEPEESDLENEDGWQTEVLEEKEQTALVKLYKLVKKGVVFVILYVVSKGFGIDAYFEDKIYTAFTPVRESVVEFINKPPYEFPKPEPVINKKYWDFYQEAIRTASTGTSGTYVYDANS